jgi:hypothetical protein
MNCGSNEVRFTLKSKESSETLQLLEPLLPDAPPGACESRAFPRPASISLCPGDYIAKEIHVPNVLHLEIRRPTEGLRGTIIAHWQPPRHLLSQVRYPESLCEAFRNMKNIHHLQIQVGTELWGGAKFLRSLATPL